MKRPVIIIIMTVALVAAGLTGFFLGRQGNRAPAASAVTADDHSGADNHATQYYRCPMHPWITSEKPSTCPICGMDLTPVAAEQGEGSGVKINAAMIQSSGVQVEKAAIRTLVRHIRTSATVVPDERRTSTITTKIMGYVEKLHANYTGQRIEAGQPLYDLYSPDLVNAQTEYLQAYRSKDAQMLLPSARQRLLNWDVTEAQIADLEKRGSALKAITVSSAVSGIVMEKMVVEGQSIEPGMVLYKVVDYSRVWIEGAVYQQDVPLVKKGQRGTIELDYSPGEQFEGTVTYIAPELNMESRTLKVRLEVANTSSLKIKPGMNATVTIHSAMNRQTVTVADQAVIHSGLRTLVVIAKGGGYFEPREIKIGQTAGGYTEVISGVQDGEDIVTSSHFLIDSESNLREAVKKLAAPADTGSSTPPMQTHSHADTPAAAVNNINAAVTALGPQKTCPVMGGAINKNLYVDYKGRRIYMCCPGCTEAITKEPEKYIGILAQRGEDVEKIGK